MPKGTVVLTHVPDSASADKGFTNSSLCSSNTVVPTQAAQQDKQEQVSIQAAGHEVQNTTAVIRTELAHSSVHALVPKAHSSDGGDESPFENCPDIQRWVNSGVCGQVTRICDEHS